MAPVPDINTVIATADTNKPLCLFDQSALEATASRFMSAFPGDVLYAVKCNPAPEVIAALAGAGMAAFDVASIEEAKLVRQYAPLASCHFMHPVKSREDISQAIRMGIRTFAIDSHEELDKFYGLDTPTLTLYVRIAAPPSGAIFDLSGKFGIEHDEAPELLRRVVAAGHAAGLTLHVGSQAPGHRPFVSMVEACAKIIRRSGIQVSGIDIGGGFPAQYRGNEEAFETIVAAVTARLADYCMYLKGRPR